MTKQQPETGPDSSSPPGDNADDIATETTGEDTAFSGAGQVVTTIDDAASFDVTKYKTDELKKRFHHLFGIAHFLPWAGAGLGASILVSLILWAVLFWPRAGFVLGALTLLYMGLQGIVVGVIAAALLVISRVFQQLTAIVDITVQTIREAFGDIRELGDPQVRAELAGGLVHGAVVPAIQSVITVKLGLLRAPISFVINRILKKTARSLTESIENKFLPDHDSQAAPNVDDMATIEDSSADSESTEGLLDRGQTHLDRLHQRVDTIARRTRRATLIPAAIVFSAVTAVSSLPWIVVFLLLI